MEATTSVVRDFSEDNLTDKVSEESRRPIISVIQTTIYVELPFLAQLL